MFKKMQKLKRHLAKNCKHCGQSFSNKSYVNFNSILHGSDNLRQSLNFYVDLELHILHIGLKTFMATPKARKL